MNIIKFSEPWDKLKNIDGFTTIRSSNPDKSRYYKSSIGKEFEISLKGEIIGRAILQGVKEMAGNDVPDSILNNDVRLQGKINYAWYSKIRSMPKVLLLDFKMEYEVE